MGKRALVISGGGAKGAYAVGALQHIVGQHGLKFDLAAGTSTGGLIVPLILADELDLLTHVYSNVETKDILKPRRNISRVFRSTSLHKVDPLARQIDHAVTQERVDRLLGDPTKELFITTVNLQTQKTVYFHTSNSARTSSPDTELVRIRDRDTMLRAVLATACIPFFMPPVNIPKGSNQQYLDGGVRDVTPLQIALDNGATEIYVIIMTPVEKAPKESKYSRSLDILQRTTDLFSSEVMLNDVREANRRSETTLYMDALKRRIKNRFSLSDQELEELFTLNDPALPNPNPFAGMEGVRIITIRPQTGDEVPGGTLDFNPERMRRMIVAGRKKAEEVMGPAPTPPDEPLIA